MKLNNKHILLLILFILTLCLMSFILGVYSLKNGLLRKSYDIYFAIKNRELNNDYNINSSSFPKIDTLDLQLSKKKRNQLIKIRSNKVNSLVSFISYDWQWIENRPWLSGKFKINYQKVVPGKFKLIGMNSDHFRESENWSFRVKLKSDEYYNGFRKFNLIVPYSRGFFIDTYYNTIYKNQGGLCINTKPIITKLLNSFQLQIFEPFFSKEIIESQQRRDGLILSDDSVDVKHNKHLKIIYPDDVTSLSEKQLAIYHFYDSVFSIGRLRNYIETKQYAFLTAVGINVGGDSHHFNGFNLYLYADPINGELQPFLREITPIYGENNIVYDFNRLKKYFYQENNLNRTTLFNFSEFDYWVNKYSLYLNKINIDEFIQKNEQLLFQYYYSKKYYPWSFAFKKRLRVPIDFNNTGMTIPNNTKRLVKFSGYKNIKDTSIIFAKQDSIIFENNTNIIVKNSTIVFSGNISSYINNNHIAIIGDSLSTIVFSNATVNLNNIHFKGFGNKIKIKNREVTAAITFSNSKISLKKCTFEGNYSGDDLVNFFKSTFICDDVKFLNAKFDALDIDYSSGSIVNTTVMNSGNDGIDLGGSRVNIASTIFKNCGDKAISVGEQSILNLVKIDISNSEIGVGLKDASELSFKKLTNNNNHIDFAAFGKKELFGPCKIISVDSSFYKLNYLIEPTVILPNSLKVIYTPNIISYMYGKKYGKASIR